MRYMKILIVHFDTCVPENIKPWKADIPPEAEATNMLAPLETCTKKVGELNLKACILNL